MARSGLRAVFAQDVEDVDLAVGPEDALVTLIEAGSLVETRKGALIAYVIVLPAGHSYDLNGRMWHLSLIGVLHMVDRDLAARAGTSAIPFNNNETDACVTILKHLREAEKDINKAFLVIERKNTVL